MGENRKTLLLILPLIVLASMLLTQQFAPKAAPHSVAALTPVAPPAGATIEAAPTGQATANRADAEVTSTIETDQFLATFTNLNTALKGLTVKGAQYIDDKTGEAQELITTDKEHFYPLGIELGGVSIPPDALWNVRSLEANVIEYRWQNDVWSVLRKWELGDAPYQLWSTVVVTNRAAVAQPVRLSVTTAQYVRREDEKGGMFGRPSPALTHGICHTSEDTERRTREKLVEAGKAGETYGPNILFSSVTNTYFGIVMAPDGVLGQECKLQGSDRGGTADEPDGTLFEARLTYPSVEIAAGQKQTFRTTVYAGPKDTEALQAFGRGAANVIDLGWFSAIAKGLNWLLRGIYKKVGNWGLAIILLTFLVKLALFPLTEKSFSSMAKMRTIKPEMDRINELYADDREKKGAAVMELYRKEGVNPVGGCLPMLLQMPIWFALYQSLSTNLELYHAPFALWWQDLSAPDPYYVLPVALGVLMLLQQKIMPTAAGMDPLQQKMMMYGMPVFITFLMLFLPAGLCLYMVTNSILSLAQQKHLHVRMDKQAAAAALVGNNNTDDSGDNTPNDNTSMDSTSMPKKKNNSKRASSARKKKRNRRG